MKKKFNVVAHYPDGDVLIGRNGKYQFESFKETLEVFNEHLNLGVNVGVYECKE